MSAVVEGLQPGSYRFGPFVLDVDRRRILANGRVVSWRSVRHFQLLRVLIDAEPDVVLYDDLRARVWNGKQIEPHTIAQTVKDLRERLGMYADCIRNQPGKGYYFDRPPSATLQVEGTPLKILTLLRVATEEWNRRTGGSLIRGLRLFRRVVELDPDSVEGHLGVAACVTMGCHVGFAMLPRTELALARCATEKALLLARENHHKAAALCQQAQIRMMYDWDFKEAERLLGEALLLDDSCAPVHHFLSHLYLTTNRWHSVMDAIMKARRIAPSSPMFHSTAGLLLNFMRQHGQAIEICEDAVFLHPDFGRGHIMLGLAYEADGQYNRAIDAFNAGLQMEEHATPLAALGHVYARAGRRAEARAKLKELATMSKTQFVSQYFLALIHAGLDQTDDALTCLEQAYKEGCDWLVHIGVEPRWDSLRRTERFHTLIAKLGLPDLGV